MVDTTPMTISPMPVVDPELNGYDRHAVNKARDAYYKEQLIRNQEIVVLRDKMRWCYRREGTNHFQNCRHLTQQYLELLKEMREGWIKPFKVPAPSQ